MNAADIVTRLRRSITTASNDDESKPGTEKRRRHIERMEAMNDAIDLIWQSVEPEAK
jgi:hypothetical protein